MNSNFLEEDNKTIIHIHIEKYKGFKTTIENLDKLLDKDELKSLVKDMRKAFSCSVAYCKKHKKQTDDIKVVKLNGDHKEKVSEYLISKNITTKDCIQIHGY